MTLIIPGIFLVIVSIAIGNAQIYFPDDERVSSFSSDSSYISSRNNHRTNTDRIITEGILNLTLSLDNELYRDKEKDISVYSPVGISAALALVLLGSNGRTFQELSNIMGLSSLDINTSSQKIHEELGSLLLSLQRSGNVEYDAIVNLATGIFVKNGFNLRSAYVKTSQNIYSSEIANVDFINPTAAEEVINSWVSKKTENKITSMLSQAPPPTTNVILCSALYFKGKWEQPFFEEQFTQRRSFYGNGRKNSPTGTVLMMSNGGYFPYYKDKQLNCEVMGLPYKGNKTTMYIIMPQNSDKSALRYLENRLSASEIDRLLDSTSPRRLITLLPKMKLETSIDLSRPLANIGAKSMFYPRGAQLNVMSGPSISDLKNQEISTEPVLYTSRPATNRREESSNNQAERNNQNQQNQYQSLQSDQQNNFQANQQNNFQTNQQNNFQTNPQNNFQANPNDFQFQEEYGSISSNWPDKRPKPEPPPNRPADRNTVPNRLQNSQPNHQNLNEYLIFSRFGETNSESIDSIRKAFDSFPNGKGNGLYVDQVVHKVYIHVTESGTEAASTTAIGITKSGDVVTFRVDTPFIFLIRDEETKMVLFYGSVYSPPSF